MLCPEIRLGYESILGDAVALCKRELHRFISPLVRFSSMLDGRFGA